MTSARSTTRTVQLDCHLHASYQLPAGDHPLTAESIARKVGIITLPTAREVAAADGVDATDIPLSDPRVGAVVMAGYNIPGLTREQWDVLLSKKEIVFARTSPQQKLQIVENYQRLGNIVAVTGDGQYRARGSPGAVREACLLTHGAAFDARLQALTTRRR